MKNDETGKFCSFCGTAGEEAEALAGGLGAFICNKCVAYYADRFAAIATADPDDTEVYNTPWERMTDVEILAQLPRISASNEQAGDFLVEWVELCRSRGLSWSAIGQAMGLTRQTVWERFSRKIDQLQKLRAANG